MKTENIIDIDNDFDGYKELINLYERNKNEMFEDININLNGWFSANVCSMLGAILSKLQDDLNTVTVNAGTAEDILERNGFLSFFGHKKKYDRNNTTVPYQVLSVEDGRYFNNYVFNEFLGKSDLPAMTNALKKKLMESIYEIFINATMHSHTEKIFVCGQFFPKKKAIEFMITDTGLGIKNVVNKRFNTNLDAVSAIKWAIEDRHTTKQGISGGIGLSLLHEFIKMNGGKIQIVSNEGFWQLDKRNVTADSFENEFLGTIVNFSIRTDDNSSYMLSNKTLDEIF